MRYAEIIAPRPPQTGRHLKTLAPAKAVPPRPATKASATKAPATLSL